MSQDQIRQAFVAWYAPIFKGGEPANMPRRRNGEYVSVQDQIAWMAYQQAAQQSVAQFLERSGQYLTNDASREAAIAEAVRATQAPAAEERR